MKNKQKIGRFALVGSVNTLLDFGILFILTHFGLPKVAANTCSTGVAFIFSFFANKKFTFKSKNTNVRRELILFVMVTLFGLWGLQNLVIWLATPFLSGILHQSEVALLVAKLLATGVSLVWNYIMYDRFVFNGESDEPYRD